MKKTGADQLIAPKQTRFVVPLAICQQVARLHLAEELQLFLYLKSICQGALQIDRKVVKSAAYYLGCSKRTVKRRLEKLEDRNWVGKFKCGVSILRSFNEIFRVEKLGYARTGVEFFTKDLKNVPAFVVSACIGYLSKQQQTKKWRERQSGVKNVTPFPPDATLLSYYPVACKFIAEIFGVSISTASEWKRMGKQAGFLSIEKKFTLVPITNRSEYARQGFDDACRIVRRNGKYYRQEADLVLPLLKYKTRPAFTYQREKSGQMPKHNKRIEGIFSAGLTPVKHEKLMQKFHQK